MTRFLFAAVLAALWFASPAIAQQRTQFVFAISWEPAFCETRPGRPECTSMTADRPDASQFSLHGLWPQRMEYCSVSGSLQVIDGEGDWEELPAPKLPAALREALEVAMPGTQSLLDRHEWVKHGTCYGTNAEEYFADSLAMLEAVNTSAVRELFASNAGRLITQDEIRAAFDKSFGAGAGLRVRVACERDGDRRIISELTIGLTGEFDEAGDYGAATMRARPTSGGCDEGIVDPVGLQ
jgi:ribonuclease T2